MASPFDSSRSKAGSIQLGHELTPTRSLDRAAESEDEEELKTRPFLPPLAAESPLVIPAPPTEPTPPLVARPTEKTRLSACIESRVTRFRGELEQAFRVGARWVGARRARLPNGLRRKLERVPSEALFGLVIAIPCFLLGGAVALFGLTHRDPTQSEAQRIPIASPLADATEQRGAREKAGTEGVAGSRGAPVEAEDEGAVLLKLAESFSAQGQAKQALGVLDRLLARRPALGSEPRVFEIFAQTVASEEESSFALLESMGEAGAAIVYRLASSAETKSGPKRRAEAWLKSRAFERTASLPLYALVKVRLAKSCEEKRALLGLATSGEKEMLEYLRELEAHTRCEPQQKKDCYACLRDDPRLLEAIARLERRLGS